MSRIRQGLRESSLTLLFGTIFVLSLVGQGLTGHAACNHDQVAVGMQQISLLRCLTTSAFAVDVAENGQWEYLQFVLLILATVWLL